MSEQFKQYHVTYMALNPFADIGNLSRSSTANIPDDVPVRTIVEWAKDAIPYGYFLKSITCDGSPLRVYKHPSLVYGAEV